MKLRKILALAMALCMILSICAYASDMPDTSQGGSATSRPPDNSTRAVNLLGEQAAIYIEYGETGYTLTEHPSDAFEVQLQTPLATPVTGEEYVLDGVSIIGSRMDWNEETEVGNSAIVINALTDETTTFVFGGAEDYYTAPDGESYNSILISDIDPEEPSPDSAVETARGVGLAFNGKSIKITNAYLDASGTGRPTIHIPSSTRDANATQLPDLIVEDSYVDNSTTRAMLLMGGDVWFLNSKGYTNSWGALSYDNTSTTMYVVNSDVQNIGAGGYAIYDAAGCTAYVYGSRVLGGNVGITVCRNATLTVDSLDKASPEATDPYSDSGELMTPAYTDGRTLIAAHDQPLMMHADMSGADSQATAYITDAILSTMDEDLVFADGTGYADWASESTGTSALASDYQSGACLLIKSHNGKAVFDNCELRSRTGLAVHSQFVYDSMASGIYPQDGVEYVGNEIVFRNMTVDGDVLHEDYMRKMDLSLENATLNGKVVSTTLAGWNAYWTALVEALPAEELTDSSGEMADLETALQTFIYNDSYETVWGVRMSIDADSVWNVTGDSSLYSLTVADPASIRGDVEIYVNCELSNDDLFYDWTSGTKIDSLEAGKTYEGVVILCAGEAEAESIGSLPLTINGVEVASIGVGGNAEEGEFQFSLAEILDLLGVELSFNEENGTVSLTDNVGLVGALIEGAASK